MNKFIKLLQWTVVSLLWCYIFYRACFISITQDEAYSYFLVKTNYWKAMPGTANTHWLNTIFERLFLWLPGPDHLWKLRGLSIISWWLFSWSVIKLSSFFNNRFLGIAFFAAAVLNPVVVFYFSLSRGYAAALALLMFSFAKAVDILKNNEIHPQKWLTAFISASLAVLANFSAFYFYMALTLVYLLHLAVKKQLPFLLLRPAFKWIVLVTATFLFSISSLLFIKYYSGDLEYGGHSGMVASLFGSLAETGIYFQTSLNVFLITGWIIFAALIIILVIGYFSYKKTKELSVSTLSVYCCAGIVLLNLILHAVFKVPFLMGRTALVIYIVLLPGLFGTVDRIATGQMATRLLQIGFSGIIIIFFCVNFYKSFNIRFFPEWTVQADTQKALDYLANKQPGKIGMGPWHFAAYNNYYSKAYPDKYTLHAEFINFNRMTTVSDSTKLAGFNYLLLDPPYEDKLKFFKNWKTELYFSDSKALILSRQFP